MTYPGRSRTPVASLAPKPYDPIRLCVFATVALISWLAGPWAVLFFALLGLAGYVKARRAGLTHSKCKLRDTRLVIAYLALIAAGAGVAIFHSFQPLI